MLVLYDSITIWTLQQVPRISLLGVRLHISGEADDDHPLKVPDQLEVNVSCNLLSFPSK